MTIDKGKQKEGTIQDERVLLYKPYNISLSNSSEKSSLDTQMIQNKINNLEKTLKILQSSVKTIPFTPPSHYKTIQVNGKKERTCGTILHINSCSRNIMQIPVVEKYSSKSIQENHCTNHSS